MWSKRPQVDFGAFRQSRISVRILDRVTPHKKALAYDADSIQEKAFHPDCYTAFERHWGILNQEIHQHALVLTVAESP